MVVNACFGPRRTNKPHTTPNCGPGKSKREVDYYRQKYYFPKKLAHIQRKLEKENQEVMYYSKNFIITTWSSLVMKNVTKQYGHHVKVTEIQI